MTDKTEMGRERQRIAKRSRELGAIGDRYRAGEEANGLRFLSTVVLVEMYARDSDWLRHPCGDIDIDGEILARLIMVGAILKDREMPFYDGRYHMEPKP
ncbi:MAG: hypothetical protein RL030_2792 [Pseudomonadota bacterium]